ncbi:MAG: hypothetical protein ACLP7O_09940 [Terracidiphilus sp.]
MRNWRPDVRRSLLPLHHRDALSGIGWKSQDCHEAGMIQLRAEPLFIHDTSAEQPDHKATPVTCMFHRG